MSNFAKKSRLISAYFFDEEGFFDGETAWQEVNGEVIEAPLSTSKKPWGNEEFDSSVFYRFVDGQWVKAAKPKNPAELCGEKVSIDSQTMHDVEIRRLMQVFSEIEGFHLVCEEDRLSIDRDTELTEEEKRKQNADYIRAERDRLLEDSMWMVQRHESEKKLGRETTLTEEQFLALLQYQQDLRDVPQQEKFPDSVIWPSAPNFVE